jgi:hypothetical protein
MAGVMDFSPAKSPDKNKVPVTLFGTVSEAKMQACQKPQLRHYSTTSTELEVIKYTVEAN